MNMAGSTGTYWLIWASSVGVGLGLLLTGLWALYANRPKGSMCPRCRAQPQLAHGSLTCSSCGFTAKRVQQFRPGARHPWLGAACFLLILLGSGLMIYRMCQQSWMAMVPGRALIAALPWTGGDDGFAGQELEVRLIGNTLTDDEIELLVHRLVTGDSYGAPPSRAWRERYGELLRRLRHSAMHTGARIDRLYELPLDIDLVTRKDWPEHSQVCVHVAVMDWWPLGTEIRFTAEPQFDGGERVSFVRTGAYIPSNRFTMFVDPLSEGAHELTYDLRIDRRRVGSDEAWQSVGTVRKQVHVSVKGTMDEVLPSVQDDALDAIMEELFSIGIARWDSGDSPVRVYFEPERTFREEFKDTAIGVSVRVMYGEQVVRDMKLWWLGGPLHAAPEMWSLGWEVPWEDTETLRHAPSESDAWSVQVVAMQDVALRVVGAKRYWEGAFRVPTQVIRRDGPAPPVPWRVLGDPDPKPAPTRSDPSD